MFNKLLLATALLVSSTFGSDVDLLAGKNDQAGTTSTTPLMKNLHVPFTFKTTTTIGFKGNLCLDEGQSILKSVMIDNFGTLLGFKFIRLPNGKESITRYAVTITVPDATVKRNNADGLSFDPENGGESLILTFDQNGHLQRFDSGQPTESDTAPMLYIEFPSSNPPIMINWDAGTAGKSEQIAHITAYQGPSRIAEEWLKKSYSLVD